MSDKENKENLPECKEDDKECQQKYRDLITASEDNIDKKLELQLLKKEANVQPVNVNLVVIVVARPVGENKYIKSLV
jgi:hypothetical protein